MQVSALYKMKKSFLFQLQKSLYTMDILLEYPKQEYVDFTATNATITVPKNAL